ncbi:MAG TPA: DUF3426 domain-containing protein [Lysobacter sp.]|nr:DUF3426 domain-containing protein [Lysobacter sp.]
MFVTCPHCGFLVAAQKSATLRCPRCGSAIDPKLAKPLARAAEAPDPDVDSATDGTAEAATDAAVAANEPAETAKPKAKRSRHAPSFVRRHAPAPVRSSNNWRWWLIVAALVLLLVSQMLLAQRNELAATARWRPLVSGLCGVLQCDVPAWREPAAFTMLQRSVQPKPGATGVLHVNASFRNDARWPQPWPTVLLTLSDMDGRQVGLRAFKPGEYRAKGGYIAPGQSTTIQLDVIEPVQPVVAFTFDFQ